MDKLGQLLAEHNADHVELKKGIAGIVFERLENVKMKIEEMYDNASDFDEKLLYDKESQLLTRLEGLFEEDFGIKQEV